MRRSLALIGVAVVLSLVLGYALGVSAQERPVRILVNGKEIQCDPPAFIRDGRTFVPIRFIAEAFGAKVEWDDAASTVIISQLTQEGQAMATSTNGLTIVTGSKTLHIPEEEVLIDQAEIYISSRVLVEALGAAGLPAFAEVPPGRITCADDTVEYANIAKFIDTRPFLPLSILARFRAIQHSWDATTKTLTITKR